MNLTSRLPEGGGAKGEEAFIAFNMASSAFLLFADFKIVILPILPFLSTKNLAITVPSTLVFGASQFFFTIDSRFLI